MYGKNKKDTCETTMPHGIECNKNTSPYDRAVPRGRHQCSHATKKKHCDIKNANPTTRRRDMPINVTWHML